MKITYGFDLPLCLQENVNFYLLFRECLFYIYATIWISFVSE